MFAIQLPTVSKNLSNTLGHLGVQQPPCVRVVLHKPPLRWCDSKRVRKLKACVITSFYSAQKLRHSFPNHSEKLPALQCPKTKNKSQVLSGFDLSI